jgi:O-antigen/teichoic acid export membrane protein
MRSRPLVRNVFINFAGQGAPLVAAAVSMPLLARGLGLERLGLLNLAWVVLGSFGLLDLGLGRALTQVVAARLVADNVKGLAGLLTLACGILFGAGLVAAAGMALSANWLVAHGLRLSPQLQGERSVRSIYPQPASRS